MKYVEFAFMIGTKSLELSAIQEGAQPVGMTDNR